MSAEAIVALVGVAVALLVAVLGFMWRDLGKQISGPRTDLGKQIITRRRARSQIDVLRTDLGKQIADSEARAEKAHARIESNVRDTENRLTARIDKQTERIDAVHRDLRGLGERIAKVEASSLAAAPV